MNVAMIQNSSSFFAVGNASTNSVSTRNSGKSANRSSADFSSSLQRAQVQNQSQQSQQTQSNPQTSQDSQPVDQSAQNIQPQDQSNPQQTDSTNPSETVESRDANQSSADVENQVNTQDAPRNFTDENAITDESAAIAVAPILQNLPEIIAQDEVVSGGGTLDAPILDSAEPEVLDEIPVQSDETLNLNPQSEERIPQQSQLQTNQTQILDELPIIENLPESSGDLQPIIRQNSQLPNNNPQPIQSENLQQIATESIPESSGDLQPIVRTNSQLPTNDLQPIQRENLQPIATESIPQEVDAAVEIDLPNQNQEPIRLDNMRTQFQSIVPIPQETHQHTQSMLVHLGGSMWDASQQLQSQSQNQIQPQIQNSNRAQTPLQASMIQIQTQSQNRNQNQIQIQPQVQNQIQPQLDSTPVQSLINNSTVEIDLTTQQTSQISQTSPITEIFDQQLNEIATEEIVPLRSESQNQNQSTTIIENRVTTSIGLTLDQILERPQQRSRNFSQNQSQNQNQNSNRNIAQPIEIQRNSRVSLIQDQAVESTSNRFDQTIQTVAIDRTTQTIDQPQQIDQPQAPQSTQDPYNIREQIVQNARILQRQGTTEMVIQLKPEHLGEMTLRVSVSSEGSVTASFHSDNAVVRTIIENTLVQLKNDLASQGIRVDNVEVSPQLGGEFLQQGQQDTSAWQNQNQSQTAQISRINLEDLDEDGAVTAYNSSADLAPVTGQNLSSDGGVNYLV